MFVNNLWIIEIKSLPLHIKSIGMRKAISIFFILLANIIILAHAVVPHHHHSKMFVAIVSVLDDDAQGKLTHSHSGTTHEHDSNSEECAINEALVAVVSQLHKDNSFDSGTVDFGSLFDLYYADIPTVVPEPVGDVPLIFQPYRASGHTDFIVRSIGLRAPPFC